MVWLKIVITTALPVRRSVLPGKFRKIAPMTAVVAEKIVPPRRKA